MRRILIGGGAVVLACLISACGGSDSSTPNTGGSSGGGSSSSGGGSSGGGNSDQATIHFFNELTDSARFSTPSRVTADLMTDTSTTAIVKRERYDTTGNGGTGTVPLSGSSVNFTATRSAGNNILVQSIPNDLLSGSTYTTVLMGDTSSKRRITIASYEQQAASGIDSHSVSVRIIHTLSLLNNTLVDLKSGSTSIATGLDYQQATPYQTIAIARGALTIDVSQGNTTVSLPCSVKGGKTYDAILAYVNYSGPPAPGTLNAGDAGLFCHLVK